MAYLHCPIRFQLEVELALGRKWYYAPSGGEGVRANAANHIATTRGLRKERSWASGSGSSECVISRAVTSDTHVCMALISRYGTPLRSAACMELLGKNPLGRIREMDEDNW